MRQADSLLNNEENKEKGASGSLVDSFLLQITGISQHVCCTIFLYIINMQLPFVFLDGKVPHLFISAACLSLCST